MLSAQAEAAPPCTAVLEDIAGLRGNKQLTHARFGLPHTVRHELERRHPADWVSLLV